MSKRWLVAVVLPAVAATTAAAGVLLAHGPESPASSASASVNPVTAQVVRTTLRTTRQYYGTLGYGTPVSIAAGTDGQAYTWLPRPAAVVRQGERLYEVDGRPVPALNGARPMWRRLAVGDRPGPDIAQLNTDLVAMGYAAGIARNTTYDWRTRAAVESWQRAQGVPVTGVLELGQVVFTALPVRVASVAATLGMAAQHGQPLLAATSTRQGVELSVPVDQAYLIRRDDQVTVTMPDAVTQVPGTITGISAAASPPPSGPEAGPSSAPQGGGSQGGGPQSAATVTAVVRLRSSSMLARFTSAPVSVAITDQQARNVLAVPISALLARPGGGYAVTVVDAAGSHPVVVTTGLYSDALVQVSGAGIRAGTTVVVPGS